MSKRERRAPEPDIAVIEGATAEAALAEVSRRFGSRAEIVGASKTLRGGIGGFFAKELIQVRVRLPGEGAAPAAGSPAPTASHDDPEPAGSEAGPAGSEAEPAPGVGAAARSGAVPAVNRLLSSLADSVDEQERGFADALRRQLADAPRLDAAGGAATAPTVAAASPGAAAEASPAAERAPGQAAAAAAAEAEEPAASQPLAPDPVAPAASAGPRPAHRQRVAGAGQRLSAAERELASARAEAAAPWRPEPAVRPAPWLDTAPAAASAHAPAEAASAAAGRVPAAAPAATAPAATGQMPAAAPGATGGPAAGMVLRAGSGPAGEAAPPAPRTAVRDAVAAAAARVGAASAQTAEPSTPAAPGAPQATAEPPATASAAPVATEPPPAAAGAAPLPAEPPAATQGQPAGPGGAAVRWEPAALEALGLPGLVADALAGTAADDDLGCLAALASAVAPLCRPLPAGVSLLVGPRAGALAGGLGLPVVSHKGPAPADGAIAAEVGASRQDWIAWNRGRRWVHLVVGGRGWEGLRGEDPLAVSWSRPEDLPAALSLAAEHGLVLGYDGSKAPPRRAAALDVAIAVRDLLPRS
ncbi:MAG: hypothetical protein ACQETV_00870 [Actinomycetota bacterium]